MGYDRIDSMYDALSKDGAQIGTRQQFKKLMLAPGKQGYKNRLGFYNAMKQDGAQIGNSYEDFARAMGLHAVKPQQARAQKPVSQPSKPMTTAERARQIGQEYMQGKAGKSKQASAGNTSSTDYMKNWQLMHKRNDQMTPVEQMQANTMRSRMQQAQKQASQQEQRRANPISQSRITPTAQNFNETMQQLSSSQAKRARAVQQREDDARNLAQYEVEGNQFAHNDGKFGTIAPEIDSLVAPSMKEADDLSWTQYQQDLKNAGNDAYLRNKAWKDLQDNRIKNRQNVLANNLSAKLQEIYSQKGLQEHIVQSADKLNMGVEEYVDKYVTPQMMQRAQNILGVKNIEEILPQSATEYVVRRLSDSILGTLSAGQDKSREQIAREQEAMAISDGLEEMPTVKGYKANEGYKSGAGARFASTAANMAMDSPILGMTGGAANMSVDLGKQVLMGGLAKAGLVKMGAKLTAQQLAFKAANMTMAQKIASGLVEGSAKGALNLGGYSSITSALGQASTGNDTSLSALGKAALEGFEHGATTGAMFGVSGAIMAPWVSKFGINGLETSTGEKWLHGAQKLGATGVGLGVEAGTMMVADNITGDKDISVGTWLEDLVMVGAFKAGEPKNYAHIGSALYGLVHNTNNTFRVGKDQNGKWRTVDIHMTKDEQNELMNSVSGKNLVETFQKVDKSSLNSKTPLDKSITKQAYQDFMNDPNVSQSTKEKVNAAMGLFNTTSAKSYRSVNDVQNKQILEYSKNGTLLTRTSYKNADERRAILYKQKLYRDNEEMRSLAGYSKLKDLQPTDENGEVTRLAFAFLTDKGYNPNETVTEANNARLIAGLRDKNSDLYKEWEKYVDRFGSLGMLISDTRTWKNGLLEVFIGDREISLDTIMRKDPMKRTDEENKIFYQVKDALESELFPNGKPHADQSETQGQSVAEDNNLGTDQPNGEAVKQELNGLRQAETEMDVLMRDNDVFSQNFKKLQSQGLTNPQIYDWMVQNGLTQEQLEPFAHYINANARVQGMQEATKQKIEEVVSGVVQDWSYHGELNGQKMNGEQVVYVQDSEGRTLIVGSGDVAFDSTTGRAKEDVGDLLICFDPNTKEMVYLKKDDVTFMQTQNPDDFGNEYRQRLQMINSQPYNEAAQEQAMQDAGKSENQNQSESIGINQNQNSESNGSEKAPQVDTTSPEASTITAKNNTTKEGLAPQEQPQQTRKFADGTDVPMTKDSKGRPTPDYGAMKPEQAAEILSQDFGENAEKVVDGQIKKAEKALKDAEKMKVDYTAEPNDILEQEQVKAQTVEAAKKQLEQAQNIKKAMTAKAVAETVGKPTDEKVEGANEASSEVAKKFQNAPRLQGNHVSKRLPNGDKISGHYEIVPAESLTPSHDAMNDYKKSEGFPVDAEGRTINDRDYEHDKAAQQTTDQMAQKYSGQAITQVPTVSDEGIVYDGNGRTMAGQKAAKNGTDAEYIEDLMDNAQNYGFTKEQIEQSGIEHPRLVMVTDERLPYDTATFSMFNRNEKKTQSNTEQAVAKAKTLTSEEVGAIVADIEGNGSLDAFFNNSKAINDLVKTLVSKGVIGQNEVAGFMDGPDRLSAQGKEYVKNLLLGSVFKPETIRMLGVDSKIKNAAINGIRAIMDNLKLGDYSLRDELDQAVQLLYEARRSKMSVEDLLKQSSAFEENARDRFPMIAQAMAQALEDKPTTFRELMSEYNNIAKNYNTNEGTLGFYDKLTPEQVVEEFLNASKAIKNNNIKLYGKESETERSNDASGNEEPAKEAGGAAGTEGNGNAETEPEIKVKKALKRIATEITKQTGIEVVTDEKVGQSTLEDAEATDSNVKYSRVTDKDLIAQLEKEPKIKVYRAMQVIDGKLYPPMAAYADGKLVEANELGKWIQSDEMPDSKNTVYKIKGSPTTISKDRAVKGEDGVWRDSKTGKELVTGDDGEPTWYFKLQKGKGADGKKLTDVPAAYNPYWHLSYSPLNDQFKSAWIRPNIVVVECEVPASELNSGYRAEHAKNSVGMTPWTSGVVTKQLIAQGHEGRKVMLSRWCKPVRVVPDAEVAAKIKEFIGDHDVEIPENVVTPRQKVELEKLGVKIGAPEKGMNKNEQIADAIKLGLQVDNTVKEQRGSRWAGGEVLGMDKLPKENQMNPDELASEISQYHSDYITRMLENVPEDGTGTFFSAHNGTWYLYTVSKEDRSINLLKAFTASRENFDKFKEAIKDYGFNTETEDIYSNLQEVGRTNRSDSDLLDAFLRGGAGRDNRVHSGETEGEANNGNLGMDERTGEDTSSPRYFRSANGEVYGFTVDGKIYLDTKKMKPETPLHEYTHLWTEALRNSNPTEWENVKGLFDEVDGLKEEVQKLYPELKGDDLYEEMITTFSGREGAKKLEEVVRGLAKEDGKTVEESSKATGFIAKVKEALQKYWKGVADMLHIHFTSAEEVADKVLADWASGFNPNKAFDVNDRQGDYMKNNVEYIVKNTKLPFGKKYGEELSQEEVKSLFYGDNNYSKKYGKLFDRVYDVARKLGIKISFKIPPETHSAYGQAYLDNVYLNPILLTRGVHKVFPNKRYSLYVKEDTLPHAILHELIHSVTCYALERYERDKDSMPKELRVAAESLIDLYEATRKATLDYVNEYGRENEQEFIAELSNPNFCKLLKKTNVWTRVKDAIKQFFFPLISSEKNVLDKSWKETNSYKELSSLLDDFLEHSDKGIFEEEIGVQNGEIKGKEEAKEEAAPVMPKPVEPSNPIEAAAEDYKKEHPLSEDEILNTTAFDDLPEDQKQYCIDAALDYLNGEDTSSIAEAYYRNAYEKRANRPAETEKVAKADSETVKAGQAEVSSDPMEGIKNAAEGFEQEKAEKERKQKEATQKVLNVIKASNEKAKTRKQLEAEKNAADNEFEAFMKDLRKKRSGQLNSGFIDQNLIEAAPKMFSLAAKCAYTRIKLGMYDAKEVVKDLRERFKDAFDGFDKRDVETFYSEIMNQKWRDGDKRMSLNEWAEHYKKVSPEYKEKLEGDSKDAEERKMSEKKFIDRVNIRLGFGQKINGIVELRKMAEECGLKDVKDTDLQELAETAIVKRARGIATSASTNDARKFELIKKLYENQPSLNQRDSERVMKQQYSTPAPYAFLADMYVKGGGKEVKSALEPSAGNGMLTIGLPMDVVHVNDIDAQRLANLRRQGFKNVTSQDGTQPFADKDVDVVVTNPPFGSATPKEYDGYKISSLEGQMAINALESMKDDGRAAIIIGGKTEYAKNGSLNPKDKAFLGYLYSHYNVEDVINVDGSLYAKQGTTYPTRIILINGRRKFDPENKVYPPVEKNARAESVKDYDELYKRINDDILRSKDKSVDIHGEEKRKGDNAGGRTNVSDSTKENGGRVGRMGAEGVSDRTPANPKQTKLDTSTRPVEQREDANGGTTESASDGNSNPDTRGGQTSVPQSERTDGSSGRGDNSISGGSNTSATDNGTDGRERGVRLQSSDVQSVSNTPTQPKEEKKQTLTTEKVAYTPSSHSMSLGAVVPARQKEALETVLNKLGDADQYLVDNLGYNDKEDLYAHLAAEQVDAVALGLKQMEKGNGFIIGDQTGIGKGRQAAAIIRYAVNQGRIPVSFTIKPNLFSDTYRDLTDIGSPELRPFILASSKDGNIKENYDEEVKGLDGRVTKVRKQRIIYNVPSTTETQRVLKYIAENGKLPEGYDYILTTYSQIRTGLQEYKGGKWKDKKKINAADRNGQLKRDAIEKLAENSIFILDESHDAAGEGSGSAFIQKVLPKAKGVTFLSATYAKTPDAMKLYALKTDLGSKSKDEKDDASWKILNAIKKGGTVFQEIMSQALTRSGQMIRRERDMTGVTIDWNPLTEDETEIQAQRDKFDNIFGIFNDILNFQRTYVDAKLGEMSDDVALIQGSVDHTPGTKDMGIGNVTFASKAYNVVQQALFSIKAEKVADYAIEAIKNGEKPVIAVNNTMEGMTDEYPMGEVMDMPDLNTTLMKGLEGILRYTEKNEYGDRDNKVLRLEELGEEAVARYNEIKEKIASATSGLSISPIDVIKHRLEQAGYRVGELTGRNTEFVYNEDGKVVRQKRTDTNKNALADRFNNGDLDVLILNRSASTGISLHASTKFKDQRQRTMIFAQMQGNINEEVQMRGRIDRTGQVRRAKYVYLVSAIPAEQRLMMMFKNKLKSLDANTTSSQKSKFNEVDVQDFTNKYGDEIVLQYMAQHPEYYNKLADPLGWGFMEYAKDGLSLGELRKNTKDTVSSPAYEVMKRLTLLPVKEQEVVLKDISDAYTQKIKQLNDMGMNDLEITDMPLEAKTLKREVWKEGSDPNGDNAFADNTYIETVEMNVLKKPMKAEEVQEAQKKMFGGKDYETWRSDKIAEIKEAQAAKIEETKAKMAEQMEKKVAKAEENTRKSLEKQNDKVQKKIDKGTQLAPGEHILTEEEIKTRISDVVADVKKKLLEKQSEAIANINTKYEMFIGPLYVCDPNKTVSVPSDWYMEDNATSSYPEFARVIGFKYDKNYNLGSSSIVFATTDSRKRVEIPLTRPKVLERIDTDTERFAKECKVITMDSWDRMIPKKDRTTGRIITGNMLEALADNNSIGHLISYTTDDGKVKQGILVPDSVSTEEITGNMPIAKAYNWFTKKEGGTELKSTDGNLRLAKNFGSMYTLYVPASRKEGGKYYLNKELLDLVHGHNFQSKGKNFWATFDAEKLHDVLHILNGMEVQVKTPKDFEESRTHFRTSDAAQGNDVQSIVANHIANVTEKVGVKANEVNSADEITNPRVKERIENGDNVTGWYDEKTGEVHLYMPNIHDRYTAEKTIWHEVVGHKGMRELFGEDRFNRFLRDVWYDLDKPEYAVLKKLVMEEMKYNPFNVYNAIEEGIARLAEDGRGEAGFWNNIKNKVSDFLHEIGYRMAPNTKDVKYLLWLSKNLQKNPNDPYWKMRAEAVKYRLDHEDVPSVIEHDGMLYDNDGKIYKGLGDLPKAEYQEATDGQIHFRTTPSAGTALDRYHRSLDEHGYMFTESYMDNMLSLKNLMTAIVPGKKIEDIASSENPYILQNTMQGAMSDAAQMFERNVMKPLDKAMAEVLNAFDGKNDDEKIRNFNLYMITKHGLERNRILYVRDALKDMRMDEKKKKLADTIENDWNNEKATLDDKLERGYIDLKEYYKQMDDFIRTYVDETNKFDAGEHDYSGIHAIQEVEKNSDPYNDAEAIQSVMDSEGRMEDIKKGAVKDYWDKVKAATQYAIDCDYRNGLISRELYGHVSAMFNWYVPLRKYDEATAEDTYGYITEKGDPKSYIGKTIMRARGHKYLSETNVLAQIGAMGNRAIKNGGQNAIKQAFARFIRNNSNNNLVTETSVWYVSDPITQTTVERYPDIPDDATADEISQIVSDFNMEMNDLASKGLATKVYRRGRIGYKFQRAENKSQHIVDVMIAGKKHSFIVNGNPRAAQALNGLLEHKNETGIGKIAGKISRFMAQTCTSYNPEFVMRNMIRDFEFSSSNLLAKEGARYTGIFEKYYAKVGIIEGIRNSKLSDFKDTGGFGLFVKYRNGTLDTSDKIQRYFKEFMENGGETGWVQIKSMKEWTEEYKRDIKAERNKAVKVGKGFYNAIFKNLENVNEIAENMARFATYCASRDSNRSVVRSAYDAKEVSTNFNRHGSGSEIKSFKNGEMGWFEEKRKQTYRYTSAWFRNTSMFFNAGIQSTNLLVKNLKNNTAGTLGYIASGPMISGMAIALLNNFLIANEDEKDRKGVKDPYGELPDYIRRNNLCVYVGGGEFVTIPLAIEERAFYGLGDLVAGLTFSPNISGQKNPFLDAVGCMSQLVPVADYLGNASFGKHPVQETVKAVMPSATSPFIEWAYNSDWKGAPIERDNKFDENQPAWMLAYKGTPDVLLDLNKKVNAWTNGVAPGNEDMLGNSFLDAVTNPSGLQHFYSSYLGGAATFAERTLGLIKHGKDTETKDVPFVRSLFYTPSEQTSLQRTKSKWYNYKDEMEVTMANVDRLKAKNVPIDKRLSNIGEYYHFQNSKDAVKVRVIELAEKQMEQWKKLRDKSSDTESIKFANENIDRIMMDAVEQLDKLN